MQKSFYRLFLSAVAVLLLSLPTIGQTGIAPASMSQCDTLTQSFMATYQVPGLTFALAKNGKLVYMRAFGNANQAGTETTQPYHLFRIASVSKPLTSIGVMKLVENGQLNLDDRVFGPGSILAGMAYFDNATVTDPRVFNITVRNLLEHSAGWNRDPPMLPNPLPPYSWGYSTSDPISFPLHVTQTLGEPNPVSRRAMIKFLMQKGLDFPPGTGYNYSNVGYLILAEVIEMKTGLTYENYMKTNIFEPIGVHDLHLGRNLLADKREREGEYINNFTTLSAYGTGQFVPWQYGGWSIEAMDAHGGWISSSRDLVRLITAVDGYSARPDILTNSTLTSMTTPSANNGGYAKGWSVGASGFNGNWWHTGALDGTASIIVRTNGQFAWAIITNKRAGGSFFGDLDALPWNCLASTSSYPAYDLFDVPSQNASAITFSNVGQTSMTIDWTNGNGDGRVLIMKAGGAPNKFPLDGTDYTGGNPFASFKGADLRPEQDLGGGNYVVYGGSGNSVTVGNLTGNTNYRFRLYEYKKNGNTGNFALYQLANNASGSQNTLAPTSASVNVGGRVMIAGGRGLQNAIVFLTHTNGTIRTARTNAFGYYNFEEVEAGLTYAVSVSSKRYQFAPMLITVNDELTGLDFTSQ